VKLARVIGSVMSTQKDPSLEGVKLLLVQPVDERLGAYGRPFIACDTVQAGTGDVVIWEGGREAALALANWFNTSDATVMGIVDAIDTGEAKR
jgi:microcompartment protein CcmK/EutM